MKIIFGLLILTFSLFSFAQEEMTEERKRMIEARKQLAESGEGALTAFGGGMMNYFSPPFPMITYEGHLIPDDGHASKQMENRFNLSAPLYQGETQTFAVTVTGGQLDFAGPITLDSGKVIASEWTRAEVGLQYSQRYASGKHWSVKAAIGYAGDDPAHLTKDNSYSFIGSYGFPAEDKDFWELFIFMANNSQIANYVPFPGVVYIHRTEHFTGAFGLPVLSMQYTPTKMWLLSTSIFGLNAQAEAAYGALRGWQGFFGYAFVDQTYIPSVRNDDRDRLSVREQKFGPGLRTVFSKKFFVEGQVGWSFARSVYIGHSLTRSDSGPSANLDDGWFGNLALKYAF
jgi:hypothetical protein